LRLRLAGVIAFAAVVTVILFVTSREWGVPFASWHTTNGDPIREDVRATVVNFDNALADGDYARACSLLDFSGKGGLRRATHAVGIGGTCEARLAAVARLIGHRRLNELKAARIYAIQYAGLATEASLPNCGSTNSTSTGRVRCQWSGSAKTTSTRPC